VDGGVIISQGGAYTTHRGHSAFIHKYLICGPVQPAYQPTRPEFTPVAITEADGNWLTSLKLVNLPLVAYGHFNLSAVQYHFSRRSTVATLRCYIRMYPLVRSGMQLRYMTMPQSAHVA